MDDWILAVTGPGYGITAVDGISQGAVSHYENPLGFPKIGDTYMVLARKIDYTDETNWVDDLVLYNETDILIHVDETDTMWDWLIADVCYRVNTTIAGGSDWYIEMSVYDPDGPTLLSTYRHDLVKTAGDHVQRLVSRTKDDVGGFDPNSLLRIHIKLVWGDGSSVNSMDVEWICVDNIMLVPYTTDKIVDTDGVA